MSWPLGQVNGGKPYADLIGPQLSVVNNNNIPNGSLVAPIVPWGVNGFIAGTIIASFTPNGGAGAGTVDTAVMPIDSGISGGISAARSIPILPTFALPAGGDSLLVFTWFDGPTPGNYGFLPFGGVWAAGSLSVNPFTFTNWALLAFRFTAGGAQPFVQLNTMRALLRG